jgi:shikimate dehydrogenase
VIVISRSGENNYDNLHLHADAALIVNTTPVGMYPNTGISPVDLSRFPSLRGVLDVVYNPARTQLLLDAENRGLVALNGLLMLVAQAKEAAQWFTGHEISDDLIPAIHDSLRRQMENIILIGMPGCGKSTIGKLLAEKCGKSFVDADEKIISLAGKPIAEIFAQDGEEVFRSWETKALEEICKQSGHVIATGGGCVTKARNYPLLHQNGTIFWLKRDLNCLAMDGRPLSQANSMDAMYSVRKPLYEAFADRCIENDGEIHETINRILRIWEEEI